GSSHPGAEAGPKGMAVRDLQWYASLVLYVGRQFGLYLPWAFEIWAGLLLVREDRGGRTSGVPVVSPDALPGSYVRKRSPLKASKREACLKMRSHRGLDPPEGPSKTTTLIGWVCKRCEALSYPVLIARVARPYNTQTIWAYGLTH